MTRTELVALVGNEAVTELEARDFYKTGIYTTSAQWRDRKEGEDEWYTSLDAEVIKSGRIADIRAYAYTPTTSETGPKKLLARFYEVL